MLLSLTPHCLLLLSVAVGEQLWGHLVTLHVATEATQAALDPQWMCVLAERLVTLPVQERAGLFEELPQGHFSLAPLFPRRLSRDTSHLLPGSRRHEALQ